MMPKKFYSIAKKNNTPLKMLNKIMKVAFIQWFLLWLQKC